MSSVYEVIRVIRRTPIFLTEHLDRLQRSVDLLKCNRLVQRRALLACIARRLEQAPVPNFNLRIHYDTTRDHFQVDIVPGRYISAPRAQKGVKVTTFPYQRPSPQIKLLNDDWAQQMQAQKEATGSFEILYVDRGKILEATKANIFFVRRKQLWTPQVNNVLEGVTRQKVIELAEKMGLRLMESDILMRDLPHFEAAFLTGTSINLLSVHSIDEYHFDTNHPVHRTLLHQYKCLMVAELDDDNSRGNK